MYWNITIKGCKGFREIMNDGDFTHPDIAALVTPLYASVKRGFCFLFSFPLCGEAGARVVQRSADRVSRLRPA